MFANGEGKSELTLESPCGAGKVLVKDEHNSCCETRVLKAVITAIPTTPAF